MSRVVFIAPQLAHHPSSGDSPAAALKRASFQARMGSDWATWLAGHFGLLRLPAAALAALPGEASTSVEPRTAKPTKARVGRGMGLLIAEPVHLAVQSDGLVYSPIERLNANDASALVATLNHHFAAEGLRFCLISPHRWLVVSDGPIDAQFVPAPYMPGASVFENVPIGPHAKHFRRVMTEAQMLFHDHAVNQSRETRREPLVNSIWLWGEGVLPAPATGRYAHVVGDDPIAAGLALWLGASWSPKWPNKLPGGDVLVLSLDGGATASEWLASAASALGRSDAEQLELIVPTAQETRVWHLTANDRYKFWRNAPMPA